MSVPTDTALELRIQTHIEFRFDRRRKLYLITQLFWRDEPIPQQLSLLLRFLMAHESEMSRGDAEFCYTLANLIKVVEIDGTTTYGIGNDSDMGLMLSKAVKHDIPLYWRYKGDAFPVLQDGPLPYRVHVKPHAKGLVCTLSSRSEVVSSPTAFLIFYSGDSTMWFSDGVLIKDPSDSFLKFMTSFQGADKHYVKTNDVASFQRKVLTPQRSMLTWDIDVDLSKYVPEDIVPIPILELNENAGVLAPVLNFQYGKSVISASETSDKIVDKGKTYLRNPKMEEIFQSDLMTLFEDHEIPFMLQSPADMAKFMHVLVPILKERQWLILSNVPDFEIYPEDVSISFRIGASTDMNWFHFEPNCDLLGHSMSLQEVARLMVQNQGYVKTKSGYVRISEESQREIAFLSDMGALGLNKKFSKNELIPFIAATNVEASGPVADWVHGLKNYQEGIQCRPSEKFRGTLRNYQQAGINWMQFLQTTGLGGILADDMGLGKTVQTIAFCSQLTGTGPVLIVGPTNVTYNWKVEIEKFLSGANILVYTGGNREALVRKIPKSHFVITTYGIVKNDIDILAPIVFKAIFVDEAQAMKNPTTQLSRAVKTLKAPFKLALTGTPIENHLMDLWNLFDFTMPGYLGTRDHFENSAKGQMSGIKAKIRPFILRRVKREVLDTLPEKTEIVVKCGLSEAQNALYQTVLSAARAGIRTETGGRERLHILTSLLKLRQVCTHPSLLAEFKGSDIVSEKFDDAKETIAELLEEGHKIVLFSSFTGMLDLFEAWLKEKKSAFERIDGSVSGKGRMAAVDRFQTSKEATVFLISLKAGGVGINLTAADYVIHMDPWWNPAAEAQATDRVHRMGQKNKVIVYKFIAEGTIEEKILELQINKTAIFQELIENDSPGDKPVNIDALRTLLM